MALQTMESFNSGTAEQGGFSPPPNNFPYIYDFYKLRILKSFKSVNNIFITYIAK
jgi:hypothetical protein